jgi:hypothetical protein
MTPTAVVFGPRQYGGIDCRTFYDEQGASQIDMILKHLRAESVAGEHIAIALAWTQRQTGISIPFLEAPLEYVLHADSVYFQSVSKFLSEINAQIVMEQDYSATLQREGDFHLMDAIIASNQFTTRELRMINQCRLWAEVHTAADLATATGVAVDPSLYAGDRTVQTSYSKELESIQERPISREPWTLWRKACKVFCDSQGKLKKPLGKWLKPSNELRRHWPYHYDPAEDRVYAATAEGFLVYYPTKIPRRYAASTEQNKKQLSKQSYPVECQEETTTLRIGHRVGIVEQRVQRTMKEQPEFEDYVTTLAIWEQPLLQNIQTQLSHEEITNFLCEESDLPGPGALGAVGVSTGIVSEGLGAYGWILATKGGKTLATGTGTATGTPIDVYRSASYGVLSMLVYIQQVMKYFGKPLPQRLQVRVMNQKLQKHIKNKQETKRQQYPNETLEPSWDVLQAIDRLWNELEEPIIQQGTKADIRDIDEIDMTKKLHQQATQEAEKFLENWEPESKETPMISGTKAQLVMIGRTVVSRYRKNTSTNRRYHALRTRIQRRTGMTDEAIDSVDWASHRTSIMTYKGSTTFLVKFLHDLLPVGKRVQQYDQEKYTSKCPSCDEEMEDTKHLLLCQDQERKKWQSELRQSVIQHSNKVGSDIELIAILDTALSTFFEQKEFPREEFDPKFTALIESQEAIGWDQVLYGRFSELWCEFQSQHLSDQEIPETNSNSGQFWIRGIVHIMWEHVHKNWIQRNEAKHGKDAETRRAAKLVEMNKKLQNLYEKKRECLPSDQQRIFYRTLEEHKRQKPEPKDQASWIQIYEPVIVASIIQRQQNKARGLAMIDDFFVLAPHE